MNKRLIWIVIASLFLCQSSLVFATVNAEAKHNKNRTIKKETGVEEEASGVLQQKTDDDIELNALNEVKGEPDEEAKIRLNAGSLRRIIGDTYTLKVRITLSEEGRKTSFMDEYDVEFRSSNPEVASVVQQSSRNAVIEGKSVGTTVITAEVRYGASFVKSLQCVVKVGPPAQSIKMVKSRVVLRPDRRVLLRTIVKPGTSVEMPRFKSKNSSIATVSSNGMVTAKRKGKTKIIATLSNGAKDSCIIRVLKSKNI